MAIVCSLSSSDALLMHVFSHSKTFSGATVSTDSCDVREKNKQTNKQHLHNTWFKCKHVAPNVLWRHNIAVCSLQSPIASSVIRSKSEANLHTQHKRQGLCFPGVPSPGTPNQKEEIIAAPHHQCSC